ncbi:MAG: hypothetical protein NC299_11775 [Lachnospiraceae bacterium]|nr:hypothetical protein [Lachnospiraceae bacterium]
MSASPEITITSENLRSVVESALGFRATDREWEKCERSARAKMQRLRQRRPSIAYYNDRYLAVLAMEQLCMSAQIYEINADAVLKLAARKEVGSIDGTQERQDS